MKKSKLIVPAALAVMLLSTAASVTGTVAWFTANRAVSVDASEFEVTTTDGNLTVEAAVLNNCYLDGKTIKVGSSTNNLATGAITPKKLTDASVDVVPGASETACGTVYTKGESFDKNDLPTSFSPVTAANNYNTDTTDVVLCVSWSLTFTYEFAQSSVTGDTAYLFFDIEKSAMSQIESETDTENTADNKDLESGKGFRIGMASSEHAIVWADLETTNNCNYIYKDTTDNNKLKPKVAYTVDGNGVVQAPTYNATTKKVETQADWANADNSSKAYTSTTTLISRLNAANEIQYGSGNNAYDLAKAVNGGIEREQVDQTPAQHDYTTRQDYVGKFVKPASGNPTIVVYCFAWFEGTDPYVVNASVLNTMTASLAFYTRK